MSLRAILPVALFVAALFGAAAAARAQPAPPQPGQICFAAPPAQTHDGFYARIQAGGGYLTARNGTTDVSGAQVALGLSAGAVVFPNLAVFAALFFHVALDPAIRTRGASMPVSGSSLENDSFGAGATYYLEPLNLYGSAAITGTSVQLFDASDEQLAGSGTGIGFQTMVGKEWWAGREWGVGLAGEVTGAWMGGSAASGGRWSSFSYTLAFSATYN
ncbi:MAG TPA: hypothetical protein VMT03_10520 [Polyangia bacterium]|nr:hypothetical protein [Polyangia bacterium]